MLGHLWSARTIFTRFTGKPEALPRTEDRSRERARARETATAATNYNTSNTTTMTIHNWQFARERRANLHRYFRSFVRSFVRSSAPSEFRCGRDCKTAGTRERTPTFLLHEPHSGHYPRRHATNEEARFCFLFFLFNFALLYNGDDDNASYRCEVVVATALGRLAAQPDRPIACRLLPSAILPLLEHKGAADRAIAETHDHSHSWLVAVPPSLVLASPPSSPLPPLLLP